MGSSVGGGPLLPEGVAVADGGGDTGLLGGGSLEAAVEGGSLGAGSGVGVGVPGVAGGGGAVGLEAAMVVAPGSGDRAGDPAKNAKNNTAPSTTATATAPSTSGKGDRAGGGGEVPRSTLGNERAVGCPNGGVAPGGAP